MHLKAKDELPEKFGEILAQEDFTISARAHDKKCFKQLYFISIYKVSK